MGYSFNQQADISGAVSSGTKSLAYGSNNIAGNLLVCQTRCSSSCTPNVLTDTQGNTWVLITTAGPLVGSTTAFWYCASAKAGANTVTFTTSGGTPDYMGLWIAEYNSGGLVSVLDTFAKQDAVGTVSNVLTSVSIIPVDNGELLLMTVFPAAGGTVTSAGTGFTIRRDNSSGGNALVTDNVSGVSGAQTTTQTISLNNDFTVIFSAFRLSGTIQNKVVVTDGDSITAGFGITTPWPSSLTLNQTSTIFNVAVSAETLATMVADANTDVDTHFVSGTEDIVIIWGGTNDFYFNPSIAAADVLALLQEYCQARRVLGFHVLVVTMISRTGLDSQKNAYNTLIRANWQSFADGLIDVAADDRLGADGAYSNTTYFQADEIHPTQLSATDIISPLVSTAINNLFSQGITWNNWYQAFGK